MITMRKTIEDSGRLNAIFEILDTIAKRNDSDLPVNVTIGRNGEAICRVSTNSVKDGIKAWMELINTTGEVVDKQYSECIEALSMLIETDLNMRLHNYANSCSHRNIPDEADLEEIRAYEVLNSSLWHLMCPMFDEYDNNFIPFSIPDGWKVQV